MRKPVKKVKRAAKPKLTAADRHARFVAMAHEVEVDQRPEAFEKAFAAVTRVEGRLRPSGR